MSKGEKFGLMVLVASGIVAGATIAASAAAWFLIIRPISALFS